jgi:hypothetical protein
MYGLLISYWHKPHGPCRENQSIHFLPDNNLLVLHPVSINPEDLQACPDGRADGKNRFFHPIRNLLQAAPSQPPVSDFPA